ncbi:uncharacterized protein N7469_005282 [Penicillium citrinum]|uniref:Uncharacterized protein n=1 Tax=Penicillium citrinum TaxID=5077 RepID=A0A9W9P1F7_PENCI|nr:uncharacterized protein N7469_005282 [Penicillium citrinum]KAJ5233516.1 hypothetical protein N7469_005282 [Penicillium citrinum]
MAAPQPPVSPPPRRSRGFSVKSDNSRRTSSSGHKSHLSESHEEKERRNLHTKADPLVAMNELQPNDIALQKSNMGSLRDIQHKDQYGNVITDPDWSNPTRSRAERPLDTIRSFEAAIYGTYSSNRPISYARTEDAASQMGDFSRRTSYHGGQGGYGRAPDSNNYYYTRNQSRPDSLADGYYNNNNNNAENYYPYQQQQNGRRRPGPRPSMDQNSYSYQNHSYQRSYDNVTAMSGSGSGNTDSYGQSTDPSSLNSSMDQLQQHAIQHQQQQRLDDRAQEYGFNFGTGPTLNTKVPPSVPAAVASPTSPMSTAQQHFAAPARPMLKKAAPPAGEKAEKRKSWFKRRFSKD